MKDVIHVSHYMALLCFVIFDLSIHVEAQPAQQPLPENIVLSAVAGSRDVDTGINVLTEAYARIGIRVDVERYTSDIALRKSNAGEVAGEVHRIDGITTNWPNLVQIPVPINYYEIAVFSRDPDFHPNSWSDLGKMRVGIVRDILAVEYSTQNLPVRRVDSYDELFRLVTRDEVDAIIVPVIVFEDFRRRQENIDGLVLNSVMDSFLLYHYLQTD